jgi:hypothetical protein
MTNIVFCADGTWNRPGTDDSADQPSFPTNVFKLYTNLDGRDSAAAMRKPSASCHGLGHIFIAAKMMLRREQFLPLGPPQSAASLFLLQKMPRVSGLQHFHRLVSPATFRPTECQMASS